MLDAFDSPSLRWTRLQHESRRNTFVELPGRPGHRILLRAQLVHVRPLRYQRFLGLNVARCAAVPFAAVLARLLPPFFFTFGSWPTIRFCPNL